MYIKKEIPFNTESIINRFKQVYGDIYDYSLVDYVRDDIKVKIICKKHGIFEKSPGAHYRQKHGCTKCSIEKSIGTIGFNNEIFIERVEKVFGKDKFDYSKLNYKDANTKIILICKKCKNEIIKLPGNFYIGNGCQSNICYVKKRKNPKQYTTEKIIELSKQKHGDLYDYYLTEYKDGKTKIKIICKKHGIFEQIPNVHYDMGCGCPKCCNSHGEEKIRQFLENNNINYIPEFEFVKEDNYFYLDFYLPEKNIVIEYHGGQHYKPIEFFGGIKGFERQRKVDDIKRKFCKENKLKYIEIPNWNLNSIENILQKELIKQIKFGYQTSWDLKYN